MALTDWKKKALDGIIKHKYALGILLLGLVLMLLPSVEAAVMTAVP